MGIRIGIGSGPVTAGVIGPDQIQITPRTYELLPNACECEPRGSIEVKGKGTMEPFLPRGRTVALIRRSTTA